MATAHDEEILSLPASVFAGANNKEIDVAFKIDKAETYNGELLKFLIIIITFEHFIAILKFVIETYIPDTPLWVERCLVQVQKQKEKLEIKKAEKELEEKLDRCNQMIDSQKQSYLRIIKEIHDEHDLFKT